MIDTTYHYDTSLCEADERAQRAQPEDDDTGFEGEHGYEEDRSFIAGVFPEKRKRSSRACDQCRKTKSKCQQASGSAACRNCLSMNQECTFLGPSRKRGPPKGYINQLEHRIHRLEALLGSLLAAHDSRAQTLIADLAMDPLGQDILHEVDMGPFGPAGRVKLMQSHWEEHIKRAAELGDEDEGEAETVGSLAAPSGNQGHKQFISAGDNNFVSSRDRREQLLLENEADSSLPSYTWQDRLINHLNTRGLARLQASASSSHADDISTAATTPIIPSAPYSFFDTETPPSNHTPLPAIQTQNISAYQSQQQSFPQPHIQHQYDRRQQTQPSYPYSSINGSDVQFYDPNSEELPLSHRHTSHTHTNASLPIIDEKRNIEKSTLENGKNVIWRTMYGAGEALKENDREKWGSRERRRQSEKMEVGYPIKVNGMHMYVKPDRVDNLDNGGICPSPQSRFSPPPLYAKPVTDEDLGGLDSLLRKFPLPSSDVSSELLALCWAYMQPVLPMLDRANLKFEEL